MKIGVLAVQGAFIEHENKLKALGVDYFEIRQKEDILQEFDGLILPGGESTVMGKLLYELDLFDILHEKIKNGLPVLGTCAGLVLLASKLSNDSNTYFATIPIKVKRNAYGRQLGSFTTTDVVKKIGTIPMTFIRAPYIEWADDSVDVLATIDNHIVAVQYHNQLALAFHPEITNDLSIHSYFVSLCKQNVKSLFNIE
jgi:5'-phosphate synthase pdxT subunit